MPDELLYECHDRVATITINREDKRNSLTWEVVAQMRQRLSDAKRDIEVGAVVVRGAGDTAFCAGADLSGMAGSSVAELHDARGEMAALFDDFYRLSKPTIARVSGYCLAGGFGLALACDLVVAAESAIFGTPEINVGLWPYMITVPLCRSMPPKKALELMMTGRRIDAAEAETLGILSRRVALDQLDSTVGELASELANKSAAVMKLGRDSFYSVWDQPASAALTELHPLLSLNASLDDATEGITAFMEKHDPEWKHR